MLQAPEHFREAWTADSEDPEPLPSRDSIAHCSAFYIELDSFLQSASTVWLARHGDAISRSNSSVPAESARNPVRDRRAVALRLFA